MMIFGIKIMSKERYENIKRYEKHLEEQNYKLVVENDQLEDVNRLLNERLRNLEDRNKDLILENNRLKK